MQKARTIEEWMLDKERDASPAIRRKKAQVPEKYHAMSWDGYDEVVETAEGESLKGILQDYADTWPSTTGLTVVGPPGWGKTCGMALLACDLIDAGVWVRWSGWSELALRKKELFGLARKAEDTDDWSEHELEELRIRWIERDCEVLFLDDVGKEYRAASGWSDAELDNLLRHRTAAGKITMVTSNLRWKDFTQYNDSMASFLNEMGEVVILTRGADMRGTKRTGAKRRAAR